LTALEAKKKRGSQMMNATNLQGKISWAGILLIMVVGLIHLVEAPEHLEEATYVGVLFFINVLFAFVSAFGIYRGTQWGWVLGILVAGGAFVMYVVSRTIGLPGLAEDVGNWLEPAGILSLIVEGLFVLVYAVTATRTTSERREPPRETPGTASE
jgi:hypothetical protein